MKEHLRNKRTMMIAGVSALVIAGSGAGVAIATGGDDSEAPIAGSDLERASAAALDHTGGGEVTDTEVGDEESLYEVEVTLEDGGQVDVQLNRDFEVVGDEAESATDDESDE